MHGDKVHVFSKSKLTVESSISFSMHQTDLLTHVSVPEHLIGFYSGQPEAVGVSIVVARPSAMALYEGSAAELLQARAGGGQSLTGALCTCASVLGRRGKTGYLLR